MQNSKTYSLKFFLTLIFLISAYRALVLYFSLNVVDLYGDEAYYWGWSRSLEFGYYSKPPFMAWTIALFTSICGNGEFCVKLPSLVFYPFTALFIYMGADELFKNKKIAFYSGLVFFTLPAVTVSSLIISTDVFLLFFWAMAFMLFVKALNSDKLIYWISAGVAGGLGLLSKYTMILFVISLLIYLALSKDNRSVFKNLKLYITMIIAVVVYIPNLIWNYNNEFVSFVHTKDISHIDKELFHLDKLGDFIGSQFGIIGPLFFAILLFLIFRPRFRDDKFKMLYIFMIVFLGIITLQSFLGKAFANWAFPAYITGVILVVYYLVKNSKFKLLHIALGINIALMVVFYHYHFITSTLNIELKSKQDPYKRVMGWEKSAKNIENITKNYPQTKLLFDDRKSMASFIYFLNPHPFDSVIWNPKGLYKNHYDLTTTLEDKIGENFILVTKHKDAIKSIKKSFNKINLLSTSKVKLYKDYSRVYYIYLLENFNGYKK